MFQHPRSDDPPEEKFMEALKEVFDSCASHVVSFHNPLLERQSESTVYVAKVALGAKRATGSLDPPPR